MLSLEDAPVGCAALHGEGAGDRGDDGGKELENLDDFVPVYFYHIIHIDLKGLLIGHTDLYYLDRYLLTKTKENREQSHVYMKYAEVHPVFAGTAKT